MASENSRGLLDGLAAILRVARTRAIFESILFPARTVFKRICAELEGGVVNKSLWTTRRRYERRVFKSPYYLSLLNLCLLLTFPTTGSTGINEAYAAGNKGDFVTAFVEMKKAALDGDRNAQLELGEMYYEGMGVVHDPSKGIEWIRKVADTGLARAQFRMGVAYDTGHGVPEDDAEAVKWLTKAAAQDLAIAQGYLGSMYYRGEGVAKDELIAEKWYRRGALRGDLNSQDNMGRLYSQGGTPKLRAEGYAWFSLAASGGHEGSRRILEMLEPRLSDAEREQGKIILEGYKKQMEETAGQTSKLKGQKFRERSLSNLTQRVTDSNRRHKARGFSVFSPSGEDWTIVYIEGINQEGETNIKFIKDVTKKSLFGKVKKFALMIARGSLHHLDGRTFREPKELLTFVQGMEGYKEGPRQQNPKFNMKLDNSPGAMCVRFDGSAIDPWASRRTGKTMLGELSGYHCVHPDAPWALVTVEYLQKHWENTAVDATRLEGEHFLKSLRFTPLP